MSTLEPQPRAPAAKAAGLTNILNNDDQPPNHAPPAQLRDSGFYSTAEASSKHTSAASFSTAGLSPTTSGYQSSPADKTPSPIASHVTPNPLVSPSVSNMSVASMVSPAAVGNLDQRRHERPISIESNGPNGATLGETLASGLASRRESVDSRINQGFSDMRLGTSPYASNNHSTTSIQSTLHNQRNPRPGLENLAIHRISNGYQPSAERNPEPKTIRTAPAITGPATGNIARAAEPTKGQAWAFPEEEIHRLPGHYDDSRRSSISDSIASSQFTTESRLPPGQRRLDDGADYPRMSGTSAEYPPVHHHSMQPKQLVDLQNEEIGGPTGSQPYSRTPELRVSHKLAERKRRTEMKELFDQLRDLMPQERGSKASKWEILTKAIAEHQRMSETLRLLQGHYANAMQENDMLRRDIATLRMSAGGHPHPSHPEAPHVGPPGPQPGPYSQDAYASQNRPELPPLRALGSGMPPGPESMTGVQYETSRAAGYRPDGRY
ncbi:putative HLH transcription factor [Stachybotrys elegans]|uniref:HLH transcription factor n=1 Tax=Stachybotrys elegans TaxID=80388 RepID=A0A8K0WVF0_9HYPO|nr:putative HLH transcription factor [Stachybotrys elegans]